MYSMKISAILFIFINFEKWMSGFVDCEIITKELCGPETVINLEAAGSESSITLLLNPTNKRNCRLNITAPSSHVINLQWYEANTELLNNHITDHTPCLLNIFLPEDSANAVWKGDPCMKDSLPEADLLTPQLQLSWTPAPFRINTRGRKLIITAVAQGDACKAEDQHVCMRIGWKPILCVSGQLVCDGNPNCPKGSSTSDEDEALCKSHLMAHNSWKDFAEEVIKKLPPGIVNTKWLAQKSQMDATTESSQIPYIHWKDITIKDFKEMKQFEATTIAPDLHRENVDSVSTALTHYGPWGYLMLGMLVCGTILMFCGLWECCFRKPKPPLDLQSQQPTTVLIINRPQDESGSHQPPNYEDLDQPPSYSTLFPNFKLEPIQNATAETVSAEYVSISVSETNESPPNINNICEENNNTLDNEIEETRLSDLTNNVQTEQPPQRHSLPRCIVTDL